MRGAYGLSLTGLGADDACLPRAPDDWPAWHIEWADPAGYTAVGAVLPVNVGGVLDFRYDENTCVIASAPCPSSAAVVHPWLGTIGAWIANERRMDTFHAGGAIVAGRLWVVLGPKEAGKSTTMAALHQAGCVVTSDDLVVLDGDRSLSGPACIDLRRQSAAGLGLGTRTILMPGRERWRVKLSPPPAEVPLAGFVLPEWGEGEHVVRSVPAAERLKILFASRSALWRGNQYDRATSMLQRASLPMFRWRRPRSFAQLSRSVDALVDRLSAQDDRSGQDDSSAT